MFDSYAPEEVTMPLVTPLARISIPILTVPSRLLCLSIETNLWTDVLTA
jgi:hypothetical protein